MIKRIFAILCFYIISFSVFSQDIFDYYITTNKYLEAKTIFVYGKELVKDFSTATVNDNINLGKFKIYDNDDKLYYTSDTLYNYNVWFKKRYADEFHLDKEVYACIFYYNPKLNIWKGGIFNKFYLSPSNTISLKSIYECQYNWPKFKNKFKNTMKFKFCLYDAEYNQFSTTIYNFDIYK